MSLKKGVRWTLVILWLGLIFYLSSQPASESRELSSSVGKLIVSLKQMIAPDLTIEIHGFYTLLRKSAHFFVFMVLGFLIMYALSFSKIRSLKWRISISMGLSIVFAILDETYQYFVPGRGAQVSDVVLDSVGAMAGIGLWLLFTKWRNWRSSDRRA